MNLKPITVKASIQSPVEKVWQLWTDPGHIVNWNHASEDWHSPRATNDLRKGGKFSSRMEARDGSRGFDFEGIYDQVVEPRLIEYTMSDGRKVKVEFLSRGDQTQVIETFDPEASNPVELQKQGWQSILNNFKKYVETAQIK